MFILNIIVCTGLATNSAANIIISAMFILAIDVWCINSKFMKFKPWKYCKSQIDFMFMKEMRKILYFPGGLPLVSDTYLLFAETNTPLEAKPVDSVRVLMRAIVLAPLTDRISP